MSPRADWSSRFVLSTSSRSIRERPRGTDPSRRRDVSGRFKYQNLLPIAAVMTMIELATSHEISAHMAPRTILLVENDPALGQLMRRLLAPLVANVLVARNGTDAIHQARAHADPIDLLVTGIVMPTMDGFELANAIAQVHPETHVLLLTEYAAESEFVRSGLEDTGYSFLAQPFTGEALAQRAEDLLCAPSKRAARPTEPHDEQSNGAEVSFGHGYPAQQHTNTGFPLSS